MMKFDSEFINVLFLTSDNEFSGIIYSYLEVGKIFSNNICHINLISQLISV